MMLIRCILALALVAGAVPAVAKTKVGDAAPPFELTTFAGEKISSETLRGKVVILNYWATWCGPCRAELPDMDTFVRRHRGQDLVVYAVATENSVPQAKLKPLASVLSFPLVAKLKAHGYGVLDGVPTNYVIDKKGVVRRAEAGAFNLQSLEAVVGPLLAEPAPQTPTTTAATP